MAALEIIEKENQKHPLTLGTLVTLLGEMGHGILRLLLCVFFLQPIPLPRSVDAGGGCDHSPFCLSVFKLASVDTQTLSKQIGSAK